MIIKFSFAGLLGATPAQTDIFMPGPFATRLHKMLAAHLILAGTWL
ncbi:MAG: hypothetical protein HHJ09_10890 [Glaciimonas sp.]|nr:hypothetical protein [Glaciimonas sp.]